MLQPPHGSLRTTQLILAVLALGMLSFTVIVVVLRSMGVVPAAEKAAGILPMVLAALVLGELPVYFVLRKGLLARLGAVRADALKEGAIPMALHTLAVIGAAMAEGLGLFGAVTVLIGGPWYVLAAPALALVLIVAQIPTRARLERSVRGV